MTETTKKRALITGITGQDGSYLAELLLSKGYEVHGLIRRASTFNTDRIDHIYQDPHGRTSGSSCTSATSPTGRGSSPCSARSSPTRSTTSPRSRTCAVSFDEPEYTGDVTGPRHDPPARGDPRRRLDCRFYQASSSEMFGATPPPQDEETPFYPRSPVRRRQGVLVLDHPQLPRGVRHVRRATASCSTTSRRAAARPS